MLCLAAATDLLLLSLKRTEEEVLKAQESKRGKGEKKRGKVGDFLGFHELISNLFSSSVRVTPLGPW
jgi:hypothetical protein